MASAHHPSEEKKKASTEAPESNADKKTLKELVEKTPFHIIFAGTPQARTTSVMFADLKAAANNLEMYDITLATVRKCANLSAKYLFCINNTNTLADTTSLGHYISLIQDNITALQEAADTSSSAVLTVQYTSDFTPPDQIPEPPTLKSAPTDDNSTGVDAGNRRPVTLKVDTAGLVAESGTVVST